MPSRPPSPCATPGCPELTERSHCSKHLRSYDEGRGSSAARGYDYRWRKISKYVRWLRPICERCRRAPSRLVDHIKPLKQGGTSDLANLQALCCDCHAEKTAKERW